MRTHSSEKRQKLELIADGYGYYWFDEQEILSEDESEEIQYSYWMIKFAPSCTRADLVQKVVKLKYPDYDSEIAALANGDTEHSEWRALAKQIADEILKI